MPNLFNKKILNNRIKDFSVENIDEKIEKIKNWQQSLSKIKGLNEKRLQSAFLKAIFEDILGYENSPQKEEWTLDIEATTDVDAKHPDGILGFFERVDNEEIRGHEGVIELKGPQISLDKDQKRQGTTYKSPVDQAFSYTNKLDKCKWVIVSNFMEIRLYKVGRSKEYYEVFLLDELDEIENFKKFYYLLNKDNLLSKAGESITYKLSEKTLKKEEDISVKFYNLYKNVRINLFEHLKENNPEKNPELLLEKAQKFLDRIIFIGFCEDKGLLPNDLLHEAIQRGKESFSPSNTAVWDQIRGVFRSIDEGNAAHDINAYNGGLFKYDNDLDGLVIENNFFEAIYKISDYDFDSDVDVNILGHIFEQSISDLEKLKSDIKDDEFDENESKRKKDGIFYTPQYITSYIVENAIGGYLEDLKEKLGYYELPDIEGAGSARWKTTYTNQHLDFYNKYEKKLKEIKVLDPACGSGAFLNQAFDYLLEEHNWLNKQRDLLKGGQSSIFALDSVQRDILKNNIFGVDLNEESVEITKLSLWLKTANKRKALTNLDNNIKCGNSLVDDPEFLKEKAFIWDNEFPNIMSKGGFDIVIGNPPYVSANNMDLTDRNYFNESEKYFSTTKKWDLYILFVEKAFEIIKDNGYFSMIIPYGILNQPFAETIRKYLLRNTKVNKILDLHDKKIFEDATVPTCVLVIKNNKNEIESNLTSIETLRIKNNFMFKELHKTPQQEFYNFEQSMIRVENIMKFKEILDKINFGNEELKNYAYVSTGAELHSKEPGGHGKFDLLYKEREDGFKPYIEGSAIEKSEKGRYCFPSIDYYLDYRAEIMRSPKFKELFESPKIIVRGSSGEFGILATFDNRKLYTSHKTTIIISKDNLPQFKKKNESSVIDIELKYILGILNSKLIDFYYQNHFSGFIDVYPTSLEKIPIAKTNNREIKEEFINKVDLLLSSRKNNKIFKIKKFKDIIDKYASEKGKSLDEIIIQSGFKNKIYSGRASKIRNFTVNINTNIITVYLDKSTSGKYEVLKFEENNKNKRKYIKYYLENLTDEQLDEIDNKYSGNILNKTLQIEIPDYNKEHVVEKVVKEWENLQQEIIGLENDIKRIDNEIDQMVYKLYNLTEKEVKVVENN